MMHSPPHHIPGLIPREALSESQKAEMFALLARHFDGVDEAQFQRDLEEKNWVLEIRRDGRLVGFSTLLVREATVDHQAITAIYSGDTIVAPEAWNSPALSKLWIAAVNALHWLLIKRNSFDTFCC